MRRSPRLSTTVLGLLLGFGAFGVSLTLFVVALRRLGTARTGAYFSVAPFVGAIVAVALGEPVTGALIAAGVLMAFGVWLHVTEHHEHEHAHPEPEDGSAPDRAHPPALPGHRAPPPALNTSGRVGAGGGAFGGLPGRVGGPGAVSGVRRRRRTRPIQETFSPTAREICWKPIASSSRARRREPASIALRPAAVTTPASWALASASSPAISTVVVRSADGAGGQGRGERGVERLEHLGLGQGGGELGGGRAVRGHDQGVERREVDRVGDVDHDPARQARAAGGDDVREGGVGDGQDDDVAGDGLVGVGLPRIWAVLPPLVTRPAMAWPMLPVPMMVTLLMVCSWVG